MGHVLSGSILQGYERGTETYQPSAKVLMCKICCFLLILVRSSTSHAVITVNPFNPKWAVWYSPSLDLDRTTHVYRGKRFKGN